LAFLDNFLQRFSCSENSIIATFSKTFAYLLNVIYRLLMVANKLPIAYHRLPPSSDYGLWQTNGILPIFSSSVTSAKQTIDRQTETETGRQADGKTLREMIEIFYIYIV
jgi:hypothetical protein